MESSRKRFNIFRRKMKAGELEMSRFRDKNDRTPVPMGFGRHRDNAQPHEFKLTRGRLLQEYARILRGYYGAVGLLLLVVILGTVVTLISPLAIKILIDYIVPGKSLGDYPPLRAWREYLPDTPSGSLHWLGFVMAGAALLGVGMEWLRMISVQRLNFRLAGTLRQRLMAHLMSLSIKQLSDYRTGGIVSRIMSDADQVVGGVQNAIINPFNALLRVGGVVGLLLYTDWRLSVGAALLIPPVLLIHMWLFRRLRPMWRNIQDDKALLSARLTDTFSGVAVVRSFRRERTEQLNFGLAQDTMIRKQQFTSILARWLSTGWGVFVPGASLMIFWYGGVRVVRGDLLMGDLVMFQSYILLLLGPVTSMIESMQNLQQNLGALDRVVDVLKQPSDMPDAPDALPLATCAGQVRLENLTFSYTPDRPVLKDVTLEIPAGATVALVGPSGSGKTTLSNLVARFYDPQAGRITLDGVDIRRYQRDDYRRQLALVLQNVYMFDGTVRDNIAYGLRHATLEQIQAAAKLANAHDFIMEMEQGYDTHLGERGGRLSGGQRQRISIARAILADPRILILDEATSSLDSQSEKQIQAALRSLMGTRTTLVIAHRLSTIMHADKIVVLVDGAVQEQGTHDELLAVDGLYARMFQQQFAEHRDPDLERIGWNDTTDPTTPVGV